MKLQLLSDLHLEVHPHLQIAPNPDADLLVLAGDIGSYQEGSRLAAPDFGLARFSPGHGWPTPAVYVPGNHEYDNADFDAVHAQLRDTCETLGILWLERESRVIDGVRFIGTTLWADFDALVDPADGMAEVLKKRGKAMRAANFYLHKAATTRHGRPFLSEALREHSLTCQAWLSGALARPFGGTTVAITHFAPTLASADPRYGLTPGTAGFCNSLDELLPKADLWLHGHLHCPFDYVKDGCRVVANPLGYVGKGEQEGFKPDLLIDVPQHPGPRSRS
ncbi:Calcineurin-like phosphoesterase [Variovorax sp. SRS16]|uniref:metallophosphoesterase n=1 Tax=Variovorax sp. SRS16 TaxID=282217 RepID=UPI00131801B5|nr:metallophosphoesterase [Variovorax sp. SRS16]VTU12923.1 Calcineurin-like phosphoesterase [Variovorax sp. SRS16]